MRRRSDVGTRRLPRWWKRGSQCAAPLPPRASARGWTRIDLFCGSNPNRSRQDAKSAKVILRTWNRIFWLQLRPLVGTARCGRPRFWPKMSVAGFSAPAGRALPREQQVGPALVAVRRNLRGSPQADVRKRVRDAYGTDFRGWGAPAHRRQAYGGQASVRLGGSSGSALPKTNLRPQNIYHALVEPGVRRRSCSPWAL